MGLELYVACTESCITRKFRVVLLLQRLLRLQTLLLLSV